MENIKTGNKTVIALALLCIIFAIALIGEFLYFQGPINDRDQEISSLQEETDQLSNENSQLKSQASTLQSQINSLTAQKNELESQLNDLEDQKNELEGQIVDLTNDIDILQSQIVVLQSGLTNLTLPKIKLIGLSYEDRRPTFGDPYLSVEGYVMNVGNSEAKNCQLHVVAIDSGGVVVIDTFIVLGSIDGESFKFIDARIFYSGSSLVNWDVTPEWTS
jgi:peptidoglycan hydrolase CwlO-like protein